MGLNFRNGKTRQTLNYPTNHWLGMSEQELQKVLVAIFGKERVAEATHE